MPNKKILVIEDESDVARYFSTLLEDNGYTVLTAADGDQAIELLQTETPDLVTLDINLPNTSGVRVYRELREEERLRHIPVLMVTGTLPEFKGFISTRRQVPPPDGYLEKPVLLADLLAEVKRLLGEGPLGLEPPLQRGLPWSFEGADRSLRS